jgi:hypothetical protein
MTMKTILLSAALAVSGTVAAASSTAITDVTGTPVGASFSSFAGPGAGTHGLEARGGRSGLAGDWEIGLGSATSQSGGFVQAQFAWDNGSLDVGQWAFEYDYSAGTSEFRIWDAATGTRPSAATLMFNGLEQGNAIEIFAKRDAAIRITELDGHVTSFLVGDVTNSGSEALILQSAGFTDGWTMKGTMDMVAGGGSRQSVLIKAGEVAPVPVPAALPLLAAGIGGLALMRRRARA